MLLKLQSSDSQISEGMLKMPILGPVLRDSNSVCLEVGAYKCAFFSNLQ